MTDETTNLGVRIRFGKVGVITLKLGGEWVAEDERLVTQAKLATLLSRPPYYEYRVWHGGYGPYLARQVAERLGGEVEVDPVEGEREEPGVVF
jgi:hypothetical protein